MDKREERLIKIVTQKLEEYGMPKFKDNYPALDIIKTIQDIIIPLSHFFIFISS